MGSKLHPGKFDCYANALPDEPMFVLLARDPSAPDLLRMWALSREVAVIDGRRPESDRALVGEARECADAMKAWRLANDGKWRLSLPADPSQRPDELVEDLARALASLMRKLETLARGAGNSHLDIEESTATSRAALAAWRARKGEAK